MKDIKQTIISNIQLACKARKIKGIDIAQHLKISPSSVSNWFHGTSFIDIENLYKLCLYLGISLNDVCDMDSVFTKDENQLLVAYRGADDRAREDAMKMLLDHQKQDTVSDQTA